MRWGAVTPRTVRRLDMETLLRMLLPLFDLRTSMSIVVLTMATAVAIAIVITLARRWRSYWWVPLALIATALTSTALAATLGSRMMVVMFADVTRNGGGIGAVSFGIWQATQLPLTAAWIGIVTSSMAMMFLLPFAKGRPTSDRAPRALLFGVLVATILPAGFVPAITFQRAIPFVTRAITPGTALPAGHVMRQLLIFEVVSAILFGLALTLLFTVIQVARRSASSEIVSLIATFALVVTVGVSAFLAASLHATSTHFRQVARGGVTAAMR